MTFDIETEVDAIIAGFTAGNVTGCSDKPVRKYLSDVDLHSSPERQDNGMIKFTQENLYDKEQDGLFSNEENYLFFGHTYLDDSIDAMEFLSELNRLFNVNNQSISRIGEYNFTWESLGYTGAGLQWFSLKLDIQKYMVEDDT